MAKQKETEAEQTGVQNIVIRLTERDCPRCDAVLIHNNNEQCYECVNCGYIHCGSDKD